VRRITARVTLWLITVVTASPCVAQTPVTSLEELRRALAPGDWLTVVPVDGEPLGGRLIRLGEADLDLDVPPTGAARDRGSRRLTMPLDAVRSLERRHDSVRNGATIGAAIGAGVGGAMFAYAFAVDRNEADEWAPAYAGVAAAATGVGALIGWMVDAANSKPHVRFDRSSIGSPVVSVHPLVRRRGGMAIAVSFSR